MKKLFAWDFHGTLEKNNVKAVKEIINKVLARYNINKGITLDEAVEFYGLSWVDYFHYMHPEGNILLWNEMKVKACEIQKKEKIVEKYIKPASYAVLVLSRIKKKGHTNVVLSNSHPKWIKYFVKLVGLDKFVKKTIGLDMHNIVRDGKDISDFKIKALEEYIKKNKFDKIVKIGDRESDIKAGKLIGATTYYIKNEFNKNIKLDIKPDYIISDLRKILKET